MSIYKRKSSRYAVLVDLEADSTWWPSAQKHRNLPHAQRGRGRRTQGARSARSRNRPVAKDGDGRAASRSLHRRPPRERPCASHRHALRRACEAHDRSAHRRHRACEALASAPLILACDNLRAWQREQKSHSRPKSVVACLHASSLGLALGDSARSRLAQRRGWS